MTDGDAAECVDKGSSSVSAAEVSVTLVPNVDNDADGMLSDQAATDDDGDVTLSSVSSVVGENDAGYPKPVSAVDTVVNSKGGILSQKLYWNKREAYVHNIVWGYNISYTLQKVIKQKPKSAESGPQIPLKHPLSGQTVTPLTLTRY